MSLRDSIVEHWGIQGIVSKLQALGDLRKRHCLQVLWFCAYAIGSVLCPSSLSVDPGSHLFLLSL